MSNGRFLWEQSDEIWKSHAEDDQYDTCVLSKDASRSESEYTQSVVSNLSHTVNFCFYEREFL